MKKIFLISAISLFLITTPVLAGKNNGKERDINDDESSVKIQLVSPAPTCNPSAIWKNHGQYVSCVAKLHLGGKSVSTAAKSDISKLASESLFGKKEDEDDEEEVEESPSPSASPSATPSASPSASPSGSASPSASPSAGTLKVEGAKIEIKALIKILEDIIKSLKHLVV